MILAAEVQYQLTNETEAVCKFLSVHPSHMIPKLHWPRVKLTTIHVHYKNHLFTNEYPNRSRKSKLPV
jgi:hypothetical protein